MSRTKSLPIAKLYIHEYAEADSTTSCGSSADLSIDLIPVSSNLLEFFQQRNIYMKNVRLEYEQMLVGISLVKPQSSNLQDVIPYGYFFNAILQIDQYHILLCEKSFHFQYLVHHLKNCLRCNRKIGVCLCFSPGISSIESLPESIQYPDNIHRYADADSTTSLWTVVPSIGITLVSSNPLKFPQPERINLNNIRYVYDQMLANISQSKPQLSDLTDRVPYEFFLKAILQTYQYHIELFGRAYHFQHLIDHLKSCRKCNTMIGKCLGAKS